jgi:exopolysaccharide production protein ExoZ
LSIHTHKEFFPLVQVLRALAALCVVLGHAQYEAAQMAKKTGQAFEDLAYPFDIGIHVFFVISGFVIVLTAQRTGQGTSAVQQFLWRRFIRVVPLYWFYTSLMIVALFIFPKAFDIAAADIGHFIKSYLFIPHERPAGGVRPLLSLGWTLNYEMFFYVVFAGLLLLPFQKALRVFYVLFPAIVLAGLFVPPDWTAVHFWSKPIILEFMAGAAIAHLRISGFNLSSQGVWVFAVLAACSFVALAFTLQDFHIHHPLNLLLKGGAGALLVAIATLTGFASSIKVPAWMTALGDSSYSLYLSHPFVLGVSAVIWAKLPFLSGLNLWIYVGMTAIAAIIGAHVAYLLLERPVLKWLQTSRPLPNALHPS